MGLPLRPSRTYPHPQLRRSPEVRESNFDVFGRQERPNSFSTNLRDTSERDRAQPGSDIYHDSVMSLRSCLLILMGEKNERQQGKKRGPTKQCRQKRLGIRKFRAISTISRNRTPMEKYIFDLYSCCHCIASCVDVGRRALSRPGTIIIQFYEGAEGSLALPPPNNHRGRN